jgi:NAD(P)-dependent dehydrogenase (short-subunit alcohol dehydrogenase family)
MHSILQNKTTLVTGVSSGIGREIAQLLAERGARVFGTAREEIEHGDELRIVAEVISRAVTVNPPALRYPAGKGVLLSRMRRFFPAGMFDKRFRKQFQLA